MIEFLNTSPEIFSVNVLGIELALRWYAMAYILGLVLAWRIAYFALSRPLIWPRKRAPLDPVQLEDLFKGSFIGALLIYLACHKGALKRPGFICGIFFVRYSIARSIVQLAHQPDAQFTSDLNSIGRIIQFGDWGLTMRQLLSLPMILIGITLITLSKPTLE